MPAKARRIALRTALRGKLTDDEVVIADLGGFGQPSSKAARKILKDLGSPRRAVVVLAEPDTNLWKSFRNFPGVIVRSARDLCAHDVVVSALVICEAQAMDQLTERVGATAAASEGAAS